MAAPERDVSPKPLRIAMIGSKGIPARHGGIERHVEEIATRLVRRGHEVTVFGRKSYIESTHVDGVEVRAMPAGDRPGLDAPIASAAASARALFGGFDVVHYHALGPGLCAPLMLARPSIRIVQTIHGLDDERRKWSRPVRATLSLGRTISYRVPDEVIVVSEALLDVYRAHRRRTTRYVPNGVTELPSTTTADVLADLGLERDGYVLFVGRLVPEKRVDLLIKAFQAASPDLRLAIVGGSSHSDAHVEALRQLAAGDDRVVFAGYRYDEELGDLYANAAIYVQPSELEGMPLTVLDALSTGASIIASDLPVHQQLLDPMLPHEHVFRTGDGDDLQAVIEAAAAAPRDHQRAFADRADRRYELSWDRVTDAVEAAYRGQPSESLLAAAAPDEET